MLDKVVPLVFNKSSEGPGPLVAVLAAAVRPDFQDSWITIGSVLKVLIGLAAISVVPISEKVPAGAGSRVIVGGEVGRPGVPHFVSFFGANAAFEDVAAFAGVRAGHIVIAGFNVLAAGVVAGSYRMTF